MPQFAENPAPVGTGVVQVPSDAGPEVGVVELAAPAQDEIRARFPVHRCGRAAHEQPEFVQSAVRQQFTQRPMSARRRGEGVQGGGGRRPITMPPGWAAVEQTGDRLGVLGVPCGRACGADGPRAARRNRARSASASLTQYVNHTTRPSRRADLPRPMCRVHSRPPSSPCRTRTLLSRGALSRDRPRGMSRISSESNANRVVRPQGRSQALRVSSTAWPSNSNMVQHVLTRSGVAGGAPGSRGTVTRQYDQDRMRREALNQRPCRRGLPIGHMLSGACIARLRAAQVPDAVGRSDNEASSGAGPRGPAGL